MTTDLHPLASAGDLIEEVAGLLENDADLSPGIALALRRVQAARAALQDYHADYEPEHARPEPVTVGARRALESIRDMTDGLQIVDAEAVGQAALRGLESIDHAATNDTAPEPNVLRLSPEGLRRIQEQQPVDPDTPDPTIEVLPLPGDRFALILSSWPDEDVDVDLMQRLSTQCGAEVVLVVPHPVFIR